MDDGARAALDRAAEHARRWLDGLPSRRIPARATPDDVHAVLDGPLPARGLEPVEVVDRLVAAVEPGLMASGSGRFYGWVMGGTLPAALAADWLVSAWDQNAGMRDATTGVVAVEEVAAVWLLDLLQLPADSGVGFATSATTAGFTALAAARGAVLARAGWDVERDGLAGAPPLRVLAGRERHGSVDMALRYLGLGRPQLVDHDDQGRVEPAALRAALADVDGPAVVVLQAGHIHSGAFDRFDELVAVAHDAGAWVHVDGAFGLWALASPRFDHLTAGLADADSWATDAHKTLNTPYDCGVAVVRDAGALRAAMSQPASYLLSSARADPHEGVPELSRRARGVPVWAALAELGTDGVRELVEQLAGSAATLADGLRTLPGVEVLNDVVWTQVTTAVRDDETTAAVLQRLLDEGVVMPSGSRWHDRAVIRFSVSSWRTGPQEVAETVEAVRRALATG
ncbi:aminotransferase class V-fold PLP-dependent enzyme [Angustibacter peucedani]